MTPIAQSYGRLRAVLVGLYVVVAVAMVAMVAIYLSSEREQLAGNARAQTATLARALEEQVMRTFALLDIGLDDAGRELLARGALERRSIPEAVALLKSTAARLAVVRAVYVFDAAGNGYATSLGADISHLRATDFEHIKRAFTSDSDRLVIGRVVSGAVTGKPNIDVGRRIVDQHGRLAGVIAAGIVSEYFDDFYRDLELGPGVSIALIRSDGVLLARAPKLRVYPSDLSRYELFRDHLSKEGSGTIEITAAYDGVRRIVSFNRAPRFGLILAAAQEYETLLAPWRRTATVAALSVVTSLGGLFAILIFSLRLLRRHAEGEERYALAIQGTQDGIWDWDLRNRRVLLSGRCKEIAGYREDEVPDTEEDVLLRFVHPDDRALLIARLRRHLRRKRPFAIECRLRHKDGSYRWALVRGDAVRGLEKTPVRLVGSITDITERKQLEEALRKQEKHIRTLFDTLPLAVGHADTKERITFANKLYRVTYCEGMDPIGRTIREVIGEQIYAVVAQRIRQVLAGEEVEFERPFTYSDGSAGTRLLRYVPERNAAGETVGFYALIDDITERKRAEQAIRLSEQRFRQTLDGMLEGCMLIGFDWTYIYVNDAAARNGRQVRENLRGRNMLEMYPGVAQTEMFASYRRVMEERIAQRFESSYIFPDGTTNWYSFSVRPVPEGIFVVSLDITERKQADQERVESAARIRELLHRLVGVQETERRRVSAELHDIIGQNLSVVAVEIENVRNNVASESLAIGAALGGISGAINEMMNTVRSTMAGLRPPLLDDYGLLAALEAYGRETERRAGLRVMVLGPPGERKKGIAQGVELALFRVAQEAITNCIKHSRATQVTVMVEHASEVLRLVVQDNGIGLERRNGAHAPRQGGWGLPVMRERVEAIGGSLKIECPEVGTRVIAEAPYGDPGHTG